MIEIVFQVQEDVLDGGYCATAVGANIFTQAETLEELKRMVRDAIRCHFDDEAEFPAMIRLHFMRDEVIPFAV